MILPLVKKIGPRTINPRNTKKIFPEYSYHINFKKSQEISAKSNDSVITKVITKRPTGVGRSNILKLCP